MRCVVTVGPLCFQSYWEFGLWFILTAGVIGALFFAIGREE